MTVTEVVAKLEALGTAQNRKIVLLVFSYRSRMNVVDEYRGGRRRGRH